MLGVNELWVGKILCWWNKVLRWGVTHLSLAAAWWCGAATDCSDKMAKRKQKHGKDVAVAAPVDWQTPVLSGHRAGGLTFKWPLRIGAGALWWSHDANQILVRQVASRSAKQKQVYCETGSLWWWNGLSRLKKKRSQTLSQNFVTWCWKRLFQGGYSAAITGKGDGGNKQGCTSIHLQRATLKFHLIKLPSHHEWISVIWTISVFFCFVFFTRHIVLTTLAQCLKCFIVARAQSMKAPSTMSHWNKTVEQFHPSSNSNPFWNKASYASGWQRQRQQKHLRGTWY